MKGIKKYLVDLNAYYFFLYFVTWFIVNSQLSMSSAASTTSTVMLQCLNGGKCVT